MASRLLIRLSEKATKRFDILCGFRLNLFVYRRADIDVLCYLGLVIATTGTQFTVATVFGAFGGGLGPAVQSLAMQLGGAANETGRLFGALSVVQTIWYVRGFFDE